MFTDRQERLGTQTFKNCAFCLGRSFFRFGRSLTFPKRFSK
ncbi:hypothetical protein Z948_1340 [Sulfitobacter donghicola DSW-25 = KCTC 12864 = JCM 14565]|nr:hypothetical protein Z948_1340 [Sulfitobacter donghicola DSW-25 = KCTC 12864 = JCM 14565]